MATSNRRRPVTLLKNRRILPFLAHFSRGLRKIQTFGLSFANSVLFDKPRTANCVPDSTMSPIQGGISHREHDPREMLLLSGGRLFQDVGYVQASIYRIASAVNAPKGTFYNYFKSKEDLASRLVDRQFEALEESLSRPTRHSASDQLKEHCHYLAIEPPMVEVAPLQLLATLAAEAPAIPAALAQRIARGTDTWISRVRNLIARVQVENGTPTAQDPQKLASLLVTCWYGAIIRRKSEPSLKLLDDFLPFFIRSGVL